MAVAGMSTVLVTSAARADPSTEAATEAELLVATRQARNGGKLQDAEAMARKGMAGSNDPVWPLTLALLLADQQRLAEALAVLEVQHTPPLPNDERLAAQGYAHLKGGDDWGALRAYGELLLLRPDHVEARSTIAGILDRQRAAYGAAALDGFSTQRAADMAAARTRWGAEVRGDDPARRFEGTDRALADLDALLIRLRADPAADPALVRRVRVDRIVALRDRVRMVEVVAEAETLKPLPAFADEAYADALLYLRRPREALAAYDRVLAVDPQSIQAAYGRVFALIEAEQMTEAIAAADALLASRPRFTGFRGGPARTPDSEYSYAAQLAAQVRLWSNQVADGHERINALADAAPARYSFREARSGAFSARGWPRAAKSEAEVAASLNPGSITSQLLLADTSLARNELDIARDRSTALLALAPENRAVQRLDQEVRARRGWIVEANLEPNFTQGGGNFALGEGYGADLLVLTPWLVGPWRLVSGFVSEVAQPPEGRVSRYQLGTGLMFDGKNVEATFYVGRNWGSLPLTSASIEISWQLNDAWSLSGTGQINSLETPIRALLADIHGNALGAGVNWRRDEQLEISASMQWLSLSDGNDRLAGSASMVSLLHTTSHFSLRGRIDAYASRNSQPGGPYFAPAQDASLAIGLAAEHISWRRYQRSFTQFASVDTGVYAQRDYGANWIGVVRYEHRWRQDPWTEIFYGIGFARRVFDGVGQRDFSLSLGVRQRLG